MEADNKPEAKGTLEMKKILYGYVVFGSIMFGLMAHELTHVIQFGSYVYSTGIIWGAHDIILPLPAFFVQATPELVTDMAYNELVAYTVQALVTLGTGLIGIYFLKK